LSIPVKERNIQTPTLTFQLTFEAGEKKEIYIKVSSTYAIFGAIDLKTPQSFSDTNNLKEKLYMFYAGAMIAIGFYNLFIFFFLKGRLYFYYVSYVFVSVVWSSNYTCFLLPYTTMETYDLLQITITIFFIILILFSQVVLETKKLFLTFHNILNAFVGILIFSLLWMLIDLHSGFNFMNLAASPLLPFLLFIAFWSLYNGNSIAKIYLLALSIYLVGLVTLSQLSLGVIPYNQLFSNAPIIGSFFENIIFSLLLPYRINVLRDEKATSNKKLLAQKSSESLRLSLMVDNKTAKLTELNKRLAIELEEKKKLEKILMYESTTDSLTGILNRRAFLENCNKEMETSKRYNHKLSFMIIVNFKIINDTHGHLNGDVVLIDVVRAIEDTIRTTDILGRIGGEEFAVYMPENDIDNAMNLAERIRNNIAENVSKLDTNTVKVTVSIGLSFMRIDDHMIQTIVRRADMALYKAKECGRNQVMNADEL